MTNLNIEGNIYLLRDAQRKLVLTKHTKSSTKISEYVSLDWRMIPINLKQWVFE